MSYRRGVGDRPRDVAVVREDWAMNPFTIMLAWVRDPEYVPILAKTILACGILAALAYVIRAVA